MQVGGPVITGGMEHSAKSLVGGDRASSARPEQFITFYMTVQEFDVVVGSGAAVALVAVTEALDGSRREGSHYGGSTARSGGGV